MDHWESTNKILDLNLLMMLGYSRKNYKDIDESLNISTTDLEIVTQTCPEPNSDYPAGFQNNVSDDPNTPENSPMEEVCSEYSGECASDYDDDISSSELESSQSEESSGFESLNDKYIDDRKDTEDDEDFSDDIIEIDSDDEYLIYHGKPKMPEWVETWINSSTAVDRMICIMKAERYSRRHQLYLKKRQRERCNGAETSTLYSLSNPSYLGVGGDQDSEVISHLIDNVFHVNFYQAEQRIQEIGRDGAFVYSACVLFPETFIHYQQESGLSYTEAEEAFIFSPVDSEERDSLEKEIEEGAKDMVEDESCDEWVDASDIESD